MRGVDGLLREIVAQYVFRVCRVHATDARCLLLRRWVLLSDERGITRKPRSPFFARLLPLAVKVERVLQCLNAFSSRQRTEENCHVNLALHQQRERCVHHVAVRILPLIEPEFFGVDTAYRDAIPRLVFFKRGL